MVAGRVVEYIEMLYKYIRYFFKVFSPGIEEKELQNISTKLLAFYETTFRKIPSNEET